MTITVWNGAWLATVTAVLRRLYCLAPLVILASLWPSVQRQTTQYSLRYTLYAVPAAVSMMRGNAHDYTSYAEVAAQFRPEDSASATALKQKIDQALRIPISEVQARWFSSGDDKGLIDLVAIAFSLFGADPSSIGRLVFLIFLLSVAVFSFQFRNSPSRIASLIALVTGFGVVSATFNITDQSTSIIEPRFLGFLSLPALFHLLLYALDGRGWKTALVQSAIVAFTIHLRSSELWQPICLLVFAAALSFRRRRIEWKAPAMLAAVITILSTWTYLSLNSGYHARDVTTRVLWHNALMGLAANPQLRELYKLEPLADGPITAAVHENMTEAEQAAVFGNVKDTLDNFQTFNWAVYEPAARRLYLKIALEQPVLFMKTYLLYMPQVAAENILYMITGNNPFPEHLYLAGTRLRKQYAGVASSAPLVVISIILISAAVEPYLISLLILVCMCSLIPPFLAMPVYQYIQVSTMLISALGTLLLGWGLSSLGSAVWYKANRPR